MGIIQNIQSILAIAVVVVINIAVIAKGVSAIVRQIKEVQTATEEEKAEAKEKAKQAIIDTLRPIIFGWVSDAERELGGGTGKLKSAKVAGWVYERIPDDLKPMFSAQEIQDIIDDVLRDAQKYWDKNVKAREYIESGAANLLTAEIGAVSLPPAAGVGVDEFVQAVSDHISNAIVKATEAVTAPPQDAPESLDGQEPVGGENVATAPADAPTEGNVSASE